MSHHDSQVRPEHSREPRPRLEFARAPSFSRAEDAPVVVAVWAIGDAAGSRGAAAALACAGADVELAPLLIDVGGRPPRPTLLATVAARALEEQLALRLPRQFVAARGRFCQLAVAPDDAGLEAVVAAISQATAGAPVVVHLPPEMADLPLRHPGQIDLSGVLLRAELPAGNPQASRVGGRLTCQGLDVEILGERLSWVEERRALFGALDADSVEGLPALLVDRLLRRQHRARDAAASPAPATNPVSHVGDA